MNTFRITVALLALVASEVCQAQSMFRGDPAHTGVYAGSAPRQFHRIKWKFPTGDRIVSSPVWSDGAIYFGGDDANIYAVAAETGRQIWKQATGGPAPSTPAVVDGTVYAVSYDGKLYALDAATGAVRWKFATGGERRFEAKGLNGLQPRNQTIADPFDVFLSSPVVVQGAVLGRRRASLCGRCGRQLRWVSNRRCGARFAGFADGVLSLEVDSYFLRRRGRNREREMAFLVAKIRR